MEARKYIISTETTCDMEMSYYREHSVHLLGMTYTLNGTEYDSASEENLPIKEFYRQLREGGESKTAQVSLDKATSAFEKLVEEGYDVFHLAFSSALSGTYQSCTVAANDVMERHPEAKIVVVDSLAASMGQGLMLNYVVTLKEQGKSLEELTAIIEAEKLRFCHNFTVDDLHFLHRGGRVSKMTAIMGTALGIKPTLHVDDEGRLINVGKVRGRKQSLNWLVDKMGERIGSHKNEVVYVSHGDCEDDAKYVADLVKKRFGIKNIVLGYIGPVIGTHSGPGTVALFFMGDTRDI